MEAQFLGHTEPGPPLHEGLGQQRGDEEPEIKPMTKKPNARNTWPAAWPVPAAAPRLVIGAPDGLGRRPGPVGSSRAVANGAAAGCRHPAFAPHRRPCPEDSRCPAPGALVRRLVIPPHDRATSPG